MQGMPAVGRYRHGASMLEQQRRVATHAPMRHERRRETEHGRLEYGMKAGTMKAATHERRVAECVEIGEDADAVDDDHGPRFRMLELRQSYGSGQLEVSHPLGDSGQMVRVGLVLGEEEASRRSLTHEIGDGGVA